MLTPQNYNNSQNIYLLKKNLLSKQNPKRCMSPSIETRVLNKKPIYKSLSESLLIENNKEKRKLRSSLIKIRYKGKSQYVSKKDFYKMKNIDIGQLKAYKFEKKEIIKQKKLFLEKANSIYNTNIIDLISENKEKEYRKGITNIQNELRKKRYISNEETKNFYENIFSIIRTIEQEAKYQVDIRIKDIDKRINNDIDRVNELQEKELDKRLEKLQFFMDKFKELTKKMEGINNDYQKVRYKIEIYKKENSILKNKIKYQNKMSKKIIFNFKSKEKNRKNRVETLLKNYWNKNLKKNVKKIYKKIKDNNSIGKKYKRQNIINEKKFKKFRFNNSINSIYNNQTNFTTNHIKNNLTNIDSNSCKNIISASNNCQSTSVLSTNNNNIYIEKDKDNNNINIKERNVINYLRKNLDIWKNKLNLMQIKFDEDIPRNPLYDLVKSIINKLTKEESDSVIYNIDNKLLTKNMKIFPYQSKIFRQIFMTRLFGDKKLYQLLISENKNADVIFNKNIFDAAKKIKKNHYI